MGGARVLKIDMEALRKLVDEQPDATIPGAINADVFEAFAKQVLLPQLRPGDVVILDNLSSHKRASIRQMIELPEPRCCFCHRTART